MSFTNTMKADPLAVTLPGRLALWATARPKSVALRDKQLGIWKEITWRQYLDDVEATACMLWELGCRPGHHVTILSDNRPEWLFADLATQGIGARAVGIYQTNPPADVAYVVNHCQSTVLFCEDQEQVDKAVEIRDETPQLEHVVVFDPRGTRDCDDSRLIHWKDFLARGHKLRAEKPDWFKAQLAERDPAEASMVVYTSGTTGPPKGAMLSSRSVPTRLFRCSTSAIGTNFCPTSPYVTSPRRFSRCSCHCRPERSYTLAKPSKPFRPTCARFRQQSSSAYPAFGRRCTLLRR